jgi:hypothetical protein
MIVFDRNRCLDLGQRVPVWIVGLSDDNGATPNGNDESQSPELADCPELARYSCQLSCYGGAGCERRRASSLPNALTLVPMHRRDGVTFRVRRPRTFWRTASAPGMHVFPPLLAAKQTYESIKSIA